MLGRDKKQQNHDVRDHTLISRSAVIKGDVEFSGGLHVQGRVEGNVSVSGDNGRLVIGESGEVHGEIRVPRVVINGRVEGDVHAYEHLELAERAVIEGNVYYTVVEMLRGAQVNGKMVHQNDGSRKNLPSPGSVNGGNGESTST